MVRSLLDPLPSLPGISSMDVLSLFLSRVLPDSHPVLLCIFSLGIRCTGGPENDDSWPCSARVRARCRRRLHLASLLLVAPLSLYLSPWLLLLLLLRSPLFSVSLTPTAFYKFPSITASYSFSLYYSIIIPQLQPRESEFRSAMTPSTPLPNLVLRAKN